MKKGLLLFFLGVSASLSAWDWGGTLENSGTYSDTGIETSSSVNGSSAFRLWWGTNLGTDFGLLMRASVSNSLTQNLGPTHPYSNTVSAALDSFALESPFLKLGRTEFRDFSGGVLDAKLDGVQVTFNLSRVELRALLGTSAGLFKSASTIIISEDDTKDRQVLEDWRQPSTLWASPRLIGGIEATARQWVRDQTFQLGALAQVDLRAGVPKDGDQAPTDTSLRTGASVSTGYLGLGWGGRIAGPLYGSLWAYGMAGTTLTAVGKPNTGTVKGSKDQLEYQIWHSTTMTGALGGASLTLVVPSLSYLLLETGAQLGSWDKDGATVQENAGESLTSMTPSVYTGWTGISRSGGAMIFNPQAANVASFRLIASVKPFDALQISGTAFAHLRATAAAIDESALRAGSTELYLGSETDLQLLWRPVSDVVATVGFGAFLPNETVFDRSREYKLKAGVNMNF